MLQAKVIKRPHSEWGREQLLFHSSNDKQTHQINNKSEMSERESACVAASERGRGEWSLSLPLKTLNMQEAAAAGESKRRRVNRRSIYGADTDTNRGEHGSFYRWRREEMARHGWAWWVNDQLPPLEVGSLPCRTFINCSRR